MLVILENLKLTAFRGMADVKLEDLAPVSIAFGDNNAGKSSILEAAALSLRPHDPSQWVQVARQRDTDISLVDGLWSLFPADVPLSVDEGPKQTKPLRLHGRLARSERELSAHALASLDWDSETAGDLNLQVICSVDGVRHTMEFRRKEPARFGNEITFYRCFTVTSASHRSTRTLVEHLSRAIDEGEKPLALELLRLFDPEVADIDVSASQGREGVRITHHTRKVVDLSSFGDGMRRAAVLALALVRAKGGLLLIDELEAGIHPQILPTLLSRLFDAARAADVQIIATTHSLDAIDAVISAVRDTPDVASSYYLRRGPQGHSVRRYSQDELISLRESGVDLR